MAGKQAKAGDQGQAEVQARMDEAHAKGYEGTVPDKTPNRAYTVAGQAEHMPEREVIRDGTKEADQA